MPPTPLLSRLDRLDREAQQVCAALSGRLDRFGSYGPRLSAALDRAMAGDVTSVADTLDSYHSVWFQLHDDLLVTLDVSREDERRRGQDPA